MFAFLPLRRVLPGVILVVLAANPVLELRAEPLSYARAQDLAEHTAPENLAGNAQVESAQSSVGPADALPDPKLILGIDNLPISGRERYSLNDDDMTMRQVGLMQEVPNSDKRLARKHLALATLDRADAERRVALLEVRRQTALGWLAVYYAERSVALFDQLDRQVALLKSSTPARIAAGNAQSSDLLMADQQALTLEDRRDELVRNVAMARAKLRRWIGPEADQPLSGEPPALNLASSHSQHGLERHPDLQAASARVSEANADLAEAISQKKPDWSVELIYSNRDKQFGDMASLQFTFDLPLFGSSRQGPRINAKQHNVEQMEAQQEAMLREHRAELESGLAEVEQLRKALERTEHSLIPLATQRSNLELAAYKAGKSQLTSVISARSDLIEAQLRRIEQQSKLNQVSASLYYAYVEGLK
ncbi:MAG: TolC family protein [Pseudomonas sp.]